MRRNAPTRRPPDGGVACDTARVILLVEDDEDVRDMLCLTLELNGHAVDVAHHGGAALEALERRRPCLVILDLVMPVMNGWQVLAQMHARRLGDIPVCVITALDERTPAEAVAALCKPFGANELLAVADRYCPHATPTPRRAAASAGSG